MKFYITLLLIGITAAGRGQSVSVSPQSVKLWGKAGQTTKVSASYSSLEVVALYGWRPYYDGQHGVYSGFYGALFWRPVHIGLGRLELRGGIGWFPRKFPTVHGTHINFTGEVYLALAGPVRLKYSHISNGFGLFNHLNPGVDHLGISVSFAGH